MLRLSLNYIISYRNYKNAYFTFYNQTLTDWYYPVLVRGVIFTFEFDEMLIMP